MLHRMMDWEKRCQTCSVWCSLGRRWQKMGCVGAAAGGDFCSEFRSWVLGVGVLASE